MIDNNRTDIRTKKLTRLLETELLERQRDAVDEISVDSLIVAFAAHLRRSYSISGRCNLRQGGLPAHMMRRVTAFIRENLAEKITIGDLAKLSGFSPGHFVRAFRQNTGLTPQRYITDLRLQLVERLIVSRAMPIAEIAKLAGFVTHSHMTATMRRCWGITL